MTPGLAGATRRGAGGNRPAMPASGHLPEHGARCGASIQGERGMLDIVDFLEQVGQDANLSHTATEALLEGAPGEALTGEARSALAAMARGGEPAAQAYCGLLFPAEEEGEGEREREPEPDGDEPARDDE